MSELIQNDRERKELLKKVIRSIDTGEDVEKARKSFSRLIREISPEEIAELEQALIAEGMPVERVQSLCDLHVEAFEQALKKSAPQKALPGHPIDTYRQENRRARRLARDVRKTLNRLKRGKDDGSFTRSFESLRQILIHYRRKENQLFPYLERVGFTGPSTVMWGKHDEIRELFKTIQTDYVSGKTDELVAHTKELLHRVRRMIFMEERILFPTAMRKLPEDVWTEIRRGEAEIGYAWITPGNLWDPNVVAATNASPSRMPAASGAATTSSSASDAAAETDESAIDLSRGALTPEQIDLMLKALPLDVTFVDEQDRVRFYSDTPHRVFPRSPGVVGRTVGNCHPPKSVKIVERIIESFRKKKRSSAEFWMSRDDRFVHIRYFALYDESGAYRGVIEVSQDVTDIRRLEGSKLLLDW